MRIVILGLSITSSWGNGHATTYRALVRHLASRGHEVRFLERDVEWYASNRDLPHPPGAQTALYTSLDDLRRRFGAMVREADVAVVGSYVPEGIAVGEWVTSVAQGVTAFYDIDTPVTLAQLDVSGQAEYLSRRLIPRFHLYLSFTGGPTLERLERDFGARMARPLYCSVDTEHYAPSETAMSWDLGYLGTYSEDRQGPLTELMLEPARRHLRGHFVVAGARYPASITWPPNVTRISHLPPGEHRRFYTAQRFAMNITRADMVRSGWSPSVRLFEAAACGTPIISDAWDGIEEFFEPGREILIARTRMDTLEYLLELPDRERMAIGRRARLRVMSRHTAAHRAAELERFALEARGAGAGG